MQMLISAAALAGFCLAARSEVPNLMPSYLKNLDGVTHKDVATSAHQVLAPRDLDFDASGSLWIVNKGTTSSGSSTVKVYNPGQPAARHRYQKDANATHFMNSTTAIAFGDNGNFANSPGLLDANNPARTTGEAGYTGPSLWNSDSAVYAKPSGGNGSHIDMLHETPYSMGIAHEKSNAYWVFCAFWNDIVRYDFATPHEPGGSDHKDGRIRRFPELAVKWISKDLPCHLILQKARNLLYIVDAGNKRIVRMDITSGTPDGPPSMRRQDGVSEWFKMTGVKQEVVMDKGLVEPVGIDIVDDHLIVSEHSTGEIIIFDVATLPAKELGRIATGAPGIMGVTIGPDGRIWYVNAIANKAAVATPAEGGVALLPQAQYGKARMRLPRRAVFDLGGMHYRVTGQMVLGD